MIVVESSLWSFNKPFICIHLHYFKITKGLSQLKFETVHALKFFFGFHLEISLENVTTIIKLLSDRYRGNTLE